jgi:hypothetical protein
MFEVPKKPWNIHQIEKFVKDMANIEEGLLEIKNIEKSPIAVFLVV